MRYFELLIDKKFKFFAFIQVNTPKFDIFLSLPLEGGGNPSEQKARDAVDGRSFSWHKVTKIHYARILLQSPLAPGQIVKQVQHQKMLQKAKASPNIFLVSS